LRNRSPGELVRLILAIGLVFALGGCAVVAIPPAVTIASYAVDGVSYIATGKSLTDHAISEVAGEDCVLIRAAVLENPCRDYVKPDSTLAVELETSYGGADVSTELAEADLAAGGPAPRGARSQVAQRRTRSTALASAAATHPAPASRYVVVGSFRERANAERARRAHAAQGAAIVPASVRGQPYYRVVTPVVVARSTARPDAVRWIIAPCAAGAATGPCLDRASVALVRGQTGPRPATVADRPAARPDSQLSEDPATGRTPASRAGIGG
jgi:hypothetical protein